MIKDAIASRVLHCQFEGKNEEVVVRFGTPRQESDYYTCEYETSMAGRSETYAIAGLDSVQAIQAAMFMAGSALKCIEGATDWSFNGEPRTGLPTSVSDWG